jgi:hypothetical protein
VVDRRQMDADLVSPTGHQVEFQKRPAGQSLPDAVAGHSFTTVGHHGHPRPVAWIAPDRRLDTACTGRHGAHCQP